MNYTVLLLQIMLPILFLIEACNCTPPKRQHDQDKGSALGPLEVKRIKYKGDTLQTLFTILSNLLWLASIDIF